MKINPRALLLWPAFTLASCGFTDGGSGSRTLEVTAELEYQAHDNETRIRIEVKKDGLPVNDAVVQLRDADKDKTYIVTQHNGHDDYSRVDGEGHLNGYHRRLELKVESNNDRVEAKLEGPGPHRVEKPANNAVISKDDVGDHLKVEWATNDGIAAQEVNIRLHRADFTHTIRKWDDPGHYDVPNSGLLVADDEEVRVTRTNNVKLEGGTNGSTFSSEYEARNSFVIED